MNTTDWKHDKADIFWGDIASRDHVVQIYESEGVLIDTMAGFVDTGVHIGDCCVVVLTKAHLKALHERLESYGTSVEALIADDGYMPFDADELLSKIMVNNWPDESLLMPMATEMLEKSRKNHRTIRVCGEMVALLWAQGLTEAALHMEHIWDELSKKEKFCLYCAYPKGIFTKDIKTSINHICDEHSKVISGKEKLLTEIYYHDTAIA